MRAATAIILFGLTWVTYSVGISHDDHLCLSLLMKRAPLSLSMLPQPRQLLILGTLQGRGEVNGIFMRRKLREFGWDHTSQAFSMITSVMHEREWIIKRKANLRGLRKGLNSYQVTGLGTRVFNRGRKVIRELAEIHSKNWSAIDPPQPGERELYPGDAYTTVRFGMLSVFQNGMDRKTLCSRLKEGGKSWKAKHFDIQNKFDDLLRLEWLESNPHIRTLVRADTSLATFNKVSKYYLTLEGERAWVAFYRFYLQQFSPRQKELTPK